MKQTAVEWLEKELGEIERNLINKTFLDMKSQTLASIILRGLFKQAKKMEKEHIMEAHYAPKYGCFSEQYYNETFKN